jgi:hypothetical protein
VRLFAFGTASVGVLGMRLYGGDGKAFAAGLFAGLFLVIVGWLLTIRHVQPSPGGAWLCRYDVQLTDGGVHLKTPQWVCDVPWHGIVAVEETTAHCFLRIDRMMVYVIPKRAFASGEAVQQFIDFAHECVSRSRGASHASA